MELQYSYLDNNDTLHTMNTIIHDKLDFKNNLIYDNTGTILNFLDENIIQSYNNEYIQKYKLHNLNEPAFIIKDKGFILREEWFKNGFNHREDGPALIDSGRFIFYINGEELGFYSSQEEDFAVRTDHLICSWCDKFCKQKCF